MELVLISGAQILFQDASVRPLDPEPLGLLRCKTKMRHWFHLAQVPGAPVNHLCQLGVVRQGHGDLGATRGGAESREWQDSQPMVVAALCDVIEAEVLLARLAVRQQQLQLSVTVHVRHRAAWGNRVLLVHVDYCLHTTFIALAPNH